MRTRFAGCLVLAAAMSFLATARAQQQATARDYSTTPMSAVQYLKVAAPGEDDKIGIGDPLVGVTLAMSADGNTLAVSTPHEDSAATGVNGNEKDEGAWEAGAAYIFVRDGGKWVQQAFIKPSNTQMSDKFGFALALSGDGNTLAVTATLEDSAARGINGNQADNSAADAGATYVYTRQGTTWVQQVYVKGANTDAGDRIGFCVALSDDGNTLGVCAYDEDGAATGVNGPVDNGAPGSGAAYVFVRRGAVWSQDAYVKPSNTIRNAAYGAAIVLSGDGNTLVVTSADEDNLTPGINGDQKSEEIAEGSAGAVYVYGRTNGFWAQQAYIKSFNIQETDLFGVRLAISHNGNVLAAGAPLQPGGGRGTNANPKDYSAPESGAVYVFTRNAQQWRQQAYLKAPNSDEFDQFGSGVAMNAQGTVLAVAANGEDGGSSGPGGNQADNSVRDSGAVFVF